MNLLWVAFYILLWWLAFFLVLPFGVRNHDEAGVATEPGVERAAPHRPMLWRKAAVAALIAAIAWAVFYTLLRMGVISLRPA